ncbi:hypothetical protein HK096_004996, partial [Nowakowskiella sp. JEL0078]
MDRVPVEVWKQIFDLLCTQHVESALVHPALVDEPLEHMSTPSAPFSPTVNTPMFNTPGPTVSTPAPTTPAATNIPVSDCIAFSSVFNFSLTCRFALSQYNQYFSTFWRRSNITFGNWEVAITPLSAKSMAMQPVLSQPQQFQSSAWFFPLVPLRTASFSMLPPSHVHGIAISLTQNKSLLRIEFQPLDAPRGKPLGLHGTSLLTSTLNKQNNNQIAEIDRFVNQFGSMERIEQPSSNASLIKTLVNLASSWLHVLEIPGQMIGVEGASVLAEFLKTNVILSTLNISSNAIGNTGAQIIVNSIIEAVNSKKNYPEFFSITADSDTQNSAYQCSLDRSAFHYSAAGVAIDFPIKRRLKTLDLSNNLILADDEGIGLDALCSVIDIKAGLENINIAGNSIIGIDKMKPLLEAIKRRQFENPESCLRSLDLGYNSPMTSDVLSEILKTLIVVESVEGKPQAGLRLLSLKGNELGLLGMKMICHSFEELANSFNKEAKKIVETIQDLYISNPKKKIPEIGAGSRLKLGESHDTENSNKVSLGCYLGILDISFNKIGPDGAKLVRDALNFISNSMRSLDHARIDANFSISKKKLTEESTNTSTKEKTQELLKELSEIKTKFRMKTLDVRSNQIGLHGARALEEGQELSDIQ